MIERIQIFIIADSIVYGQVQFHMQSVSIFLKLAYSLMNIGVHDT